MRVGKEVARASCAVPEPQTSTFKVQRPISGVQAAGGEMGFRVDYPCVVLLLNGLLQLIEHDVRIPAPVIIEEVLLGQEAFVQKPEVNSFHLLPRAVSRSQMSRARVRKRAARLKHDRLRIAGRWGREGTRGERREMPAEREEKGVASTCAGGSFPSSSDRLVGSAIVCTRPGAAIDGRLSGSVSSRSGISSRSSSFPHAAGADASTAAVGVLPPSVATALRPRETTAGAVGPSSDQPALFFSTGAGGAELSSCASLDASLVAAPRLLLGGIRGAAAFSLWAPSKSPLSSWNIALAGSERS